MCLYTRPYYHMGVRINIYCTHVHFDTCHTLQNYCVHVSILTCARNHKLKFCSDTCEYFHDLISGRTLCEKCPRSNGSRCTNLLAHVSLRHHGMANILVLLCTGANYLVLARVLCTVVYSTYCNCTRSHVLEHLLSILRSA